MSRKYLTDLRDFKCAQLLNVLVVRDYYFSYCILAVLNLWPSLFSSISHHCYMKLARHFINTVVKISRQLNATLMYGVIFRNVIYMPRKILHLLPSILIFVGQKFRHLAKISSVLSDKVLSDKYLHLSLATREQGKSTIKMVFALLG